MDGSISVAVELFLLLPVLFVFIVHLFFIFTGVIAFVANNKSIVSFVRDVLLFELF
jgi:hypothetical protein